MHITLSVNVDMVDKARFFKGKKGRYMDLVLWETPDSEYGDFLVKQRGKMNEKMPILGNGKYLRPKGKPKDAPDNESDNDGDDEPW